MSEKKRWSFRESLLALFAFALVLFVYGAVPFLTIPTLGQTIWSMGFSQSLANGQFFDLYAHDFGIPNPAAIAFGLAGVWSASILIRLSLPPVDAYSVMAALWLALAMYSAYRIAYQLGATRSIALLGGLAWMTMPIIWKHAGYSMLSMGIALLSFYFLSAFQLFLLKTGTTRITPMAIAVYFAATIIAVFMDGYTFMMFATGASILLLYALVTCPETRSVLIKIAIPTHIASFAMAYILFSSYIGKSGFDAYTIDFFRGWGLDLSTMVIPTKGVLWLPDLLGLSVKRTDELYFGDESVWVTTFALPVLVLGLASWWRVKRHRTIATGILFVAIVGFYMALGPSLKIGSTKPESLQHSHPRHESALMPAEFALMPTGNAWISETLPGFNVMRSAYRWSALGIFALWFLIMIQLSRKDQKNNPLWLLGLLALILCNLPDLQKRWHEGRDYQAMFKEIDRDLVAVLRQHIQPAEKVAFIPWGNDFIANYIAPAAGFRTSNIGGDKNLNAAQLGWSPEMLVLGGQINLDKVRTAIKILSDGTADVLVIPYFNMQWSPQMWPCLEQTTAKLDSEQKEVFLSFPEFTCPDKRKVELNPVILAFKELPYVEVQDTALFATIRLRPEFSGTSRKSALEAIIEQ
jgi:hypothetical protein